MVVNPGDLVEIPTFTTGCWRGGLSELVCFQQLFLFEYWNELSGFHFEVQAIGKNACAGPAVLLRSDSSALDFVGYGNYSNYMRHTELKITRIGNSKGIRVPAATLRRYGIGATVLMEETSDGIILRTAAPSITKLSWENTAREMAIAPEDWHEWEATIADGLGNEAWVSELSPKIAERAGSYGSVRRRKGVKRYEIRWADLEPAQGAEMAKKRPVVVVSMDILNQQLETVTICPLTSSLHPAWRSRLQVKIGRRHAEIAVDQIRTISKHRLGSKLATLSEAEAALLRRMITEMYGE
jgi:mRNA interferase MazF